MDGSRARFEHGTIYMTPGVRELFAQRQLDVVFYLGRHLGGDWGSVPPEDAAANEEALALGNRVLSAYEHEGTAFWIITEADRSSTTMLLPDEY